MILSLDIFLVFLQLYSPSNNVELGNLGINIMFHEFLSLLPSY